MEPDECPDCEYGTVAHYRVEATGEVVQVCDECDALWEAEEDLTAPSVTTIERYLSLRGLPLLRSGLVPLL
ncbi:hypothetical protein RCG67_06590 [Kocuria sp. CPCC 205292]|uniref:hypothetical protein n=1 Tax=Kocuria cellulosilytica TaxID=3071451 RepID=UPI0034D77D7C